MNRINVDTIEFTTGSLTSPSIQYAAWNHVDASSAVPVTQDSFNISSNTDIGQGRVGHNFTNNMANINYSCAGTSQWDTTGGATVLSQFGILRTVNMFQTTTAETDVIRDGQAASFFAVDASIHSAQFFGDLA